MQYSENKPTRTEIETDNLLSRRTLSRATVSMSSCGANSMLTSLLVLYQLKAITPSMNMMEAIITAQNMGTIKELGDR